MKSILLACGSGIVTSTAANDKLTKELNKRGYEGKFKITQCRISEVVAKSTLFDFCVATSQVPTDVKCPVIRGIPFLTGIGIDALMEEVIKEMEK
ncbi:MAG: PTS sugar transporter subunit IIB [Spirochaetaceae bacterium]|jgi:PTS system galactitol-specific IIB component|nr:PTS sugar transporter subunit IIB [Spirochaetaceae bacterium]